MIELTILDSDCLSSLMLYRKITAMYFFPQFLTNTTEIPNLMGVGYVPKIMGKNPVVIKSVINIPITKFLMKTTKEAHGKHLVLNDADTDIGLVIGCSTEDREVSGSSSIPKMNFSGHQGVN